MKFCHSVLKLLVIQMLSGLRDMKLNVAEMFKFYPKQF
jgi:hypothetical protein